MVHSGKLSLYELPEDTVQLFQPPHHGQDAQALLQDEQDDQNPYSQPDQEPPSEDDDEVQVHQQRNQVH